jgi:hypothetical protein
VSLRKRRERGKGAKKLPILGNDALGLRLLQHYLGHENMVGAACSAPWEIPALTAVKGEDFSLKAFDAGDTWHRDSIALAQSKGNAPWSLYSAMTATKNGDGTNVNRLPWAVTRALSNCGIDLR